MPGAPLRRPVPSAVPTGLRALAALIAEALGGEPALAGPSLWHSTIELPSRRPGSSARPAPRPSRDGTAPEPAAGGSPTGDPTDDPSEGPNGDPTGDPTGDASEGPTGEPVDDEHAAVWLLVRRAQDGDGEAFGVLYDKYVDVVFKFIYYRINDRALAEDFTSETFLRALRRIGSITYQGRDIGAWFITIARNIVLDHVKSARNRLETTTATTIETKDHHERSTEAAVLDTLQSERLMEAVGSLGDEQRDCIMLRFIQGFSVSETAAIMGKNDGAVKALQHRAVRKLADLVGTELR